MVTYITDIKNALKTLGTDFIAYHPFKLRLQRNDIIETYEISEDGKDANIKFKDLNVNTDVSRILLSVTCTLLQPFDKPQEED